MKKESRTITVYAEPLRNLLVKVDPGGFLSNDLGVSYGDDGSGFARKLYGLEVQDEGVTRLEEVKAAVRRLDRNTSAAWDAQLVLDYLDRLEEAASDKSEGQAA